MKDVFSKACWVLAFAVCVMVVPSLATASTPALDQCNGCSSWQVTARAEQRYVASYKLVYVLDYASSSVWKCDVYYEREMVSNFASCDPASQSIKTKFDEIVRLVNLLKSNEVEIPYPGGNIYEISGCPSCARGWLLDNRYALSSQLGLVNMLSAAGIAFAGELSVGVLSVEASYEANTVVKITLSNDASNGREKAYCLARLTGAELAIDVNSCVDSDGNPIPTMQNPALNHRYGFTSALNHSGMINRLRSMGRRVVYIGIATVGEPVRVECSANDCETKEPPEESDGQ